MLRYQCGLQLAAVPWYLCGGHWASNHDSSRDEGISALGFLWDFFMYDTPGRGASSSGLQTFFSIGCPSQPAFPLCSRATPFSSRRFTYSGGAIEQTQSAFCLG